MAEALTRPAPRSPLPRLALTERQQIRAAAQGDERAFAAIYRRHSSELYRYCVTILGSPEDAADAVQNAVAKSLSALRGGAEPRHLKAWLYRIAHNEAIDLVRRRRGSAQLDEAETVVDQRQAGSLESRAELRELISDLTELPERQRGALVMRELGGLSIQEIAGALQTNPGAAKQAIYEARAGLHEMAEGRAMECAEVRKSLSDADGRRLRGRQMRAHLRACPGCTDFRSAIAVRTAELHAIPVLPLVGGGALLSGIFGGGGGGGATGGGGFAIGAAGIAGTTAAKVAAVAVLTAAVGFGGSEATKLVGGGDDPVRDSTSPLLAADSHARDAARPQRASSEAREPQRRSSDAASSKPSSGNGADRERADQASPGAPVHTGPAAAPSPPADQAAQAPVGSPGQPSTTPAPADSAPDNVASQADPPSQASEPPQAPVPPTPPSGTPEPTEPPIPSAGGASASGLPSGIPTD